MFAECPSCNAQEYLREFGGSAEEFDKADKNHDGTVDATEFSADGSCIKSAEPRVY